METVINTDSNDTNPSAYIISHIHDKANNMITINNPCTRLESYRYMTDVIIIDVFDTEGKFDHKLAMEVDDAKKLVKQLNNAINQCKNIESE